MLWYFSMSLLQKAQGQQHENLHSSSLFLYSNCHLCFFCDGAGLVICDLTAGLVDTVEELDFFLEKRLQSDLEPESVPFFW